MNLDLIYKKIIKIGLQIMAVIFIASVSSVFLIRTINKKADEIFSKRVLFLANQKQQDLILKLEADYKNLSSYFEIVEKAVPVPEDVIIFINKLNDLSAKNSISQSFRLTGEPVFSSLSSFKNVPFNLVLNGDFDNEIVYINEMEYLPFFFNIDSFDISKDIGGGSSQINIKGSLYTR